MFRITIRAICIVSLVCYLGASGASGQNFFNMTEDVGRGFGDSWNRYAWSMESFGGKTYVGTWNVQADYVAMAQAIKNGDLADLISGGGDPLAFTGLLASQGGEIWRHDGGQNWTKVLDSPAENQGFRKMVVHDGNLVAATANYQAGAEIIYSQNGTFWTNIAGGPLNNPDNTSIRTMLSQGNMLYVGTENSNGAELWAYNSDTDVWTQKEVFAQDTAVAEIATFGGKMYVGTWDFGDTYRLHCSADTDNWQEVTPQFAGSDQLENWGVMQLREFKNKLYLGTVNYVNGFTLLRSDTPDDDASWEVITTDGMGDPDNAYTWAGAEFDGKLYIGTFNHGLRVCGGASTLRCRCHWTAGHSFWPARTGSTGIPWWTTASARRSPTASAR